MLSQGTIAWCGALVQKACTWSTGSAVNRKNIKTRPIGNMGKLSKNHFSSVSVKDWCMSPHGITEPPDQSSRNSGNKLRLTTPLTRPNFVVFPQSVHSKRCRGLRALLQWSKKLCILTCKRDPMVRDRDETESFGNYVSRPSRDRDVETDASRLGLVQTDQSTRTIKRPQGDQEWDQKCEETAWYSVITSTSSNSNIISRLLPPCVSHVDILFYPCGFFFLSPFSSPILSGRRLDVYHTSAPVSYTHLTLPTIYSV